MSQEADIPDFHQFLKILKDSGQIEEVREKLTGVELAQKALDGCRNDAPAILYAPDGSVPLLLNAYSSLKRLETAFGMSCEDVAEKAYKNIYNKSELKFVKKDGYRQLKDLSDLPLHKYHEHDTSASITFGCVITENDGYNSGIYRVEPISDTEAVIHCRSGLADYIKPSLPVTIAVGCSPFLVFTSACCLPADADELTLASVLGTESFVKSDYHPVPSETNVIISGRLTGEMRLGGSFYNHTGRYTERKMYPVMKIEKIEIKEGGVFQSTVIGKPPAEDVFLGSVCARVNFHRFKDKFDVIKDIRHPLEGVFGRIAYVSAEKYPDELKSALVNDGFYGKFDKIFLFDADTDVGDASDVLWRIANRADLKKMRKNCLIEAY